MATVTYTFGDARTNQIIAELPIQSPSLNESLDGSEFRGTLHLDLTGYDNNTTIAATVPGRNYVVVERDNTIIGDYIIRSRTYQAQSKSLQIYGSGWKDYSNYRNKTTNYSQTKEQRNIFIDLYNDMQSDANSLQVSLPSIFSTQVTKNLVVLGSEYKTYRQIIDSIADGDDGFDWVVRTSKTNGVYTRLIDIGYPTLGSPINHGAVTFEYPGNVLNYWENETMGDSGTHFFGIGAGEGSSMLTATVTHTDLLSAGFPRYDVDVSLKDVNNSSILASRTNAEALKNKAPLSVITIEVKGDREPIFGSYGIGDMCRLVFTDAKHPNTYIKSTRILAWEYYPPDSSNVEKVKLSFEGD